MRICIMFALLLLLSLQMNRSTPELLNNQDSLAAMQQQVQQRDIAERHR